MKAVLVLLCATLLSACGGSMHDEYDRCDSPFDECKTTQPIEGGSNR